MARLAMHGTYFSINPKPHGTYLANLQPPLKPSADTDSAIAAAAHATLSALYPTQKASSDARRLRYFGSLVGITGRTRDNAGQRLLCTLLRRPVTLLRREHAPPPR